MVMQLADNDDTVASCEIKPGNKDGKQERKLGCQTELTKLRFLAALRPQPSPISHHVAQLKFIVWNDVQGTSDDPIWC